MPRHRSLRVHVLDVTKSKIHHCDRMEASGEGLNEPDERKCHGLGGELDVASNCVHERSWTIEPVWRVIRESPAASSFKASFTPTWRKLLMYVTSEGASPEDPRWPVYAVR